MKENPIVQRQQQLTQQWLDFTEKPDTRLCRWLVTDDELGMLQAFYQLQNSEGNDTGDFFLKLTSSFAEPTAFVQDLQQEFFQKIKELQELVDDPLLKKWKPLKAVPGTSPILHFLSTLGNFAQSLDLPEGFVVIYLQPQSIFNRYAWSDWLVQVLQMGIPQRVRWMLTDFQQEPYLKTLAQYFPQEVVTIAPDLKMSAAVNELASAGDPANPGVQFRKAFVHLTQAIGRQDLAMVDQTAVKAFKIANANGWPHMKVAVNMARAGAYLGKQQYDKAYKIYGEAYDFARAAYKEGDKPSGKLSVTTLFSQGAAMIAAEKYDVAVHSYTQAVPYAEEAEDLYNLMEAWRMTGFCYQQLHQEKLAWNALWQALEIGPKVDDAVRPNSTLPYIGQALMAMAEKSGEMNLYYLVRDRMVFLVGEDWVEKAKAV
ncbi:MAG: hypothetical protein ACFB15_16390 [Cyclobacteriaceae bacterium]